jgi:hypothetical protein
MYLRLGFALHKNKINSCLLLCLFASSAPALWAQQPPSAGSQLQQIPPPPSLPPKAAEIRIENGKQAPLPMADQTSVRVDALRITGAHTFTEAALLEASGFKAPAVMTLDAPLLASADMPNQ